MIHVPTAPGAHLFFDVAAWTSGIATSVVLYRWRLRNVAQRLATRVDAWYFVALALGAVPGAWLAGSLNSLQQATPTLSHSIAGALAGAIVGVEIYKALKGIKGSTGTVFVGSFAVGVAIGRFGCFFAGLADDTYGTPTMLPWAVDFGDGVGRHPVQIYESVDMTLFLIVYCAGLHYRRPWAIRRGFHAMCIWYGAQRFALEFLKPYPEMLGPFNLFHVLCLGLIVYGACQFAADRRREHAAQGGAVPVPGPDHQPL